MTSIYQSEEKEYICTQRGNFKNKKTVSHLLYYNTASATYNIMSTAINYQNLLHLLPNSFI